MWRALASLTFITACGTDTHALDIGKGETVTLPSVNGDVGCNGGTAYLPPSNSINGSLDATDCVLKIMGTINGPLTAKGGVVHVIDAVSVNGDLEVTQAAEV